MAAEPVREWVEQNGKEVAPTSQEELAKFQPSELESWGRIIREAEILSE